MKKTVGIFIILLLIVASVALGFYFGQTKGVQQAEEELRPLIDRLYPPPPAVIHDLEGTVDAVRGGTIGVHVLDPDDYLPHPDGSPRNTELRFAFVSSNTELVLIDRVNRQPDGSATVTQITLAEIEEGDAVKLISSANIRDAKKFDVTRVEVIRY